MIDRHARSKLAEASRWLVSGLVTNYEYDDLVLDDATVAKSDDLAVREIYETGFWLLYDDMHKYRLKGRDRLSPQSRAAAARCILFLKSDLPYGWSIVSRWARFPLGIANVFTIGGAGVLYSRWAQRGRDATYWPFASFKEYSEAKTRPSYLSGRGL